MGLFSKKKKEDMKNPAFQPYENNAELPPLPEYHETMMMPSSQQKKPVFEPLHKKETYSGMKEEYFPSFEMPQDDVVPLRKKKIEQFKPIVVERPAKVSLSKEKPMFIKLEKYKEVTQMVALIKEKLREIESILMELNRIKKEEDRELDSWHHDLERIKEQLLEIDKKLFEP